MRAGLYTPRYVLPLVHPKLIETYRAREAQPQDVAPFNPRSWETVHWRLSLQYDAKKAIPKPEWIRSGPERLEFAVNDTQAALANPAAKWIEGASFFANVSPDDKKTYGFFTRTFLLEPLASDRSHVNLYEVAADEAPTDYEVLQMALQCSIMQRSGLTVDKASFLVASASQLAAKHKNIYQVVSFEAKDFTEAVCGKIPEADKRLTELAEELSAHPPRTHSEDESIPEVTAVSALAPAFGRSGDKWRIVNHLTALGITDLGQIPEDFFRLSPMQVAHIRAHRAGEEFVRVDKLGLRKIFAERKFPVHYLDFETRTVIDPDGTRHDVPFQFSDHILNEDGSIVHVSHLAEGSEDPRLRFAECLAHAVGDVGTVVVYYQDFEASRIRETASYLREIGRGELADKIEAIIPRMQDQLEYLRNSVIHSGFQGAYKLKVTHPVLVKKPEKTYDQLAIKNGEEATNAIEELCKPETTPERRAFLRAALEEYCGLDTFAMVEIDRVLKVWADAADDASAQ